jgi:hypothetical protein
MLNRMFQYERHNEPLAHPIHFAGRLTHNILVVLAFIAVALGIGMIGYHVLEGMAWIDAFLNASMILSGMGPVSTLTTTAGKLFAGTYALCSGILIVAASGLLLAPLLHRILHNFHLEGQDRKPKPKP